MSREFYLCSFSHQLKTLNQTKIFQIPIFFWLLENCSDILDPNFADRNSYIFLIQMVLLILCRVSKTANQKGKKYLVFRAWIWIIKNNRNTTDFRMKCEKLHLQTRNTFQTNFEALTGRTRTKNSNLLYNYYIKMFKIFFLRQIYIP